MEAKFEPGGGGRDSVMTLRLEGGHDIFRFAVNMLSHQVEFMEAGRAMLVELREHLTPERFDPMARSLLGEDRYGKLRTYFERDRYCSACDRTLRAGSRYVPVEMARSICRSCAVGHTFERALCVVPAKGAER